MDQTVDSLLKVISVQFSHSVVSNSLWSHGLQHDITSSRNLLKLMSSDLVKPSKHLIHTVPFLSHLQYFPASGPFRMSQLFALDAQSIEVSASASVLPMNIQDWFILGWTGWIFLKSKGLSRLFCKITVSRINYSTLSFLYSPTLTSTHN